MEKFLTVDILLKDCPIFSQNPLDPLYKYCEKVGIKKVNSLLKCYYKGDLDFKNSNTRAQLDGFIDLLLFQYFGDISKEILMILNSKIPNSYKHYEYMGTETEALFRRLGFSLDQIKQIVKNIDPETKDDPIIDLLDCKFFLKENKVSENIQNKINLLQKMHFKNLHLQEEKKETLSFGTLPDSELAKEIGKMNLEDCGIFCTGTHANKVYKSCISRGFSTIESFFAIYPSFYPTLSNRADRINLQGIVDLILFQYFEKKSEKIADLLKQPFSIVKKEDSPVLSLHTQEIFLRLGFSSIHIRLIEKQNLFVYRSGFRIIDFLIEEYKKKDYVPFKAGSVETTYFHIVSLLVRHFNPEEERLNRIAYLQDFFGDLMDKAASLSKTAQEVQRELQTLQVAEMKFCKERKE